MIAAKAGLHDFATKIPAYEGDFVAERRKSLRIATKSMQYGNCFVDTPHKTANIWCPNEEKI